MSLARLNQIYIKIKYGYIFNVRNIVMGISPGYSISTRYITHILQGYSSAGQDNVIKWKQFPRHWPFVRVIHRWIRRTNPVTRSFDVFFYRRPNVPLSQQRWGWWFDTSLCPLWRHYIEQLLLRVWSWSIWSTDIKLKQGIAASRWCTLEFRY